ncbi:MAG: very short patch repair endonuclease [Verrucomicrobiales bacterium]|nr:very short patch repair endonuclease [Verrucomicrobiales bacterium]
MPDRFTRQKRSAVMARIRSRGNRDTELALARLLRRHGITGWRRHRAIRSPKSGGGKFRVRPDFVFPKGRLAIFVDGCFWHGCPKHAPPGRWLRKSSMSEEPGGSRGKPARTGKRFWQQKLAANRTRDRAVNRALRAAGWRVLRVWEHELQSLKAEGRMQNAESVKLVRRIQRALG